jgi:hypothetical protein
MKRRTSALLSEICASAVTYFVGHKLSIPLMSEWQDECWIINWKGLGRILSSPSELLLRHLPVETSKVSVMASNVPVDIRTEYLHNKILECRRSTNPSGVM